MDTGTALGKSESRFRCHLDLHDPRRNASHRTPSSPLRRCSGINFFDQGRIGPRVSRIPNNIKTVELRGEEHLEHVTPGTKVPTRISAWASAKRVSMSRVGGQLGFIEPQLLTSVDQPPRGDEWLHEIKHDGYRTLLVVEGGQAPAPPPAPEGGARYADKYTVTNCRCVG